MSLHPVDLTAYLAEPGPCDHLLRRLFPRSAPLTIFEIGACEGEETIRYSRLFPRARIVAFEPLPANQEIIRENFARHGVGRAELEPLALSDRAGPAVFHVSAGRPAELFGPEDWNYGNKSSSLLPPAEAGPMHGWIEFPEKIEVRCDTLDAVCARRGVGRIDFIHMDVQGAEALVLAGAGRMLPRVGALWLEVSEKELYAGQKLRPHLEALLQARGFRLVEEQRRGVEGDQFYVNPRFLRARLFLARRALLRILRGAARRLRSRPPVSP